MFGMLYIAITAALMLGAIFDAEGIAVLAVGVVVPASAVWLLLVRRP